jgi:hypothetical protein
MLLFRPELGLPGAYIFPLDHALIYNIPCVIYPTGPARLKNMSPALTAALILPEI